MCRQGSGVEGRGVNGGEDIESLGDLACLQLPPARTEACVFIYRASAPGGGGGGVYLTIV